jgi:WD40 repeat protein
VSRIFLSHSSTNNPQALAVAGWLKESGWADYFLDLEPAHGLTPGERWQEALKAAADRCEAVLFLISPAWRDSRWCLAEFLMAKQLGKTIFGVLVEPTPLDTLPREMTTEWQLCDLTAGTARRVVKVSQEPFVAATDVSFAEAGLERLRLGLQKAGLTPSSFAWPPPDDPARSPYRGLKPLEAGDAAVFFGRDAAIVRGLDALRTARERGVERMLVILGASGAGKSSFLRAGLWPRLARDDRHFLPLPVIRPERAAVSGATGLAASLDAACRRLGAPRTLAEIRAALRADSGLGDLLGDLQERAAKRLEPGAPMPTVVIPIDQGEELFNPDGRGEAEAFLAMLARSLTVAGAMDAGTAIAERRRVLVIVAIRSDGYERLQTEPRLEGIKPCLISLPPLSRGEFKSVIEGPTARATAAGRKLVVEPALTEKLLEDGQGPDALPLLAFTLERLLVECGGDGDLRLDEYVALGGLRGSLEAAITAAFQAPGPGIPVDPGQRERLLRTGFVPWLAGIDPDTDERRRRVARWDEIPIEARPLLERLVDQRLLLRDRRRIEGRDEEVVVVEVAHEALLRQWPTLTAWLDEDADALKALDAVKRAADQWARNGKGDAWLIHAGERLTGAEALKERPAFQSDLGETGGQYLAACRRQQEALRDRERQLLREKATRLRQLLASTAAILLLTLAGTVLIVRGRTQARSTAAQADFDVATLLLESGDKETPRAVAHLTRSLRNQPDNWRAAERLAGLFQERSWPKPIGEPIACNGLSRFPVFSQDGQRLLTLCGDSARLWDLRSGQAIGRPLHQGDMILAAAFSPDGQRILAVSKLEGRYSNGVTGVPTGEGFFHEDWAEIIFAEDGTHLLGGSRGGGLQLWNARTGQPAGNPMRLGLSHSNWSRDQSRVVGRDGRGRAQVWDVVAGRRLAEVSIPNGIVEHAVFSPDGSLVVTTSDDNVTRIWDALSGKLRVKSMRQEDSIRVAKFSPDGRRVLTVDSPGAVRVWNALTGKLLGQPLSPDEPVNNAIFNSDGTRVLTFLPMNRVRIWSVEDSTPIGEPIQYGFLVRVPTFSPDGTRVLTVYDKTARVWNALDGKLLGEPMRHECPVLEARFSPEGSRIVTECRDGTVRLWEPPIGRRPEQLSSRDAMVFAAFGPNAARLITISGDGLPRVWDVPSARPLGDPSAEKEPVLAATFSPDGSRVLTATSQGVGSWDTVTGKKLAEPLHYEEGIGLARFSADAQRLITVSLKSAKVWNLVTGKAACESPFEKDPVTRGINTDKVREMMKVARVAINGSGTHFTTASLDETVIVWDAVTCRPLGQPLRHSGRVTAVSFSPVRAHIVTGSRDGIARVWESGSGRLLTEMVGRDAAIEMVAFDPGGTRVVTASSDDTARIWDAVTGQPLGDPLRHGEGVTAASFSPDGRRVVSASNEKVVRLWDVPPSSAVPSWFLGWAEAVAGKRFDEGGVLRLVTGSVPSPPAVEDEYAKIARRSFAIDSNRGAAQARDASPSK